MAEAPKRPTRKAAPKKKAAPRKKPAAKATPRATAKPKAKAAAKPKAVAATKARIEEPRNRRPLWRRVLRWGLALGLVFVGLSVGWVLLYRYVNPPITALMLVRHYRDDATMAREWRDLADISPDLALAVIASEDQRFPNHHGFDTVELRKAVRSGARAPSASRWPRTFSFGRRARGRVRASKSTSRP
jgi:hypothetical protein